MENNENLIFIDDLTGLYNRRYLYSQLPLELQIAAKQNYCLWLFMLDIDNFKYINDTYGHLCGDQIIKDLSVIMRENTKTVDKKVRYAGDEFTIILPQLDAKDVIKVAERLLLKVRNHVFTDKRSGKEIKLSISLGIAGFPNDATEAISLINLADKALYLSKQKGRDCISCSSEISPETFWKKDLLEKFPCPVFVDREDELFQLEEKIARANKSSLEFVLISGDTGIGKSRLLHELNNRATVSAGALCLSFRCEEKFMIQPYHVLGQLLYNYFLNLDKLPDDLLSGFTGTELIALYEFMPLLKDIAGAPEVLDNPTGSKEGLENCLLKLLNNMSTKVKPLRVFLDDFHYIDSETLHLLTLLVKEHKDLSVFVAAAYSPQDLSAAEMLSSPFSVALNTGEYKEAMLVLGKLDLEHTKEMIAAIFGSASLSEETTGLIYKITAGNPLFIEELLKFIIDKEYLVYAQGNWKQMPFDSADLPVSIEDAIRKRIAGLSAETKQMIAKAAAIGEVFEVDFLQSIDSEDKGYVLDLIESAKKVGLVYEKLGASNNEFSFAAGKMRDIIFDSTASDQMKHFYSRIAQIKEKVPPEQIPAVAGELYYNFKKSKDWARADYYSKIIEQNKAAFYDRTVMYAQTLAEEAKEQKAAVALSKGSLAIIPELIRHIYIASVNYVLYPPKSRMRAQAVEEIYKRLSQIFAETDILTVANLGEALIVNNKKLAKESKSFFWDGFVSLLKNLNIESITFKNGLSLEELSKFIEVINNLRDKEEGLSVSLTNSGVSGIKINEVNYSVSKTSSKEKESLQEVMLMDYLTGKLPSDTKGGASAIDLPARAEEIQNALEKFSEQASKETGQDKDSIKAELMSKSIQKIGNQMMQREGEDWAKYKDALAKMLLSLEPKLRDSVLAAEALRAEEGKEKTDILKDLSQDIPDDIITELITSQYLQKGNDITALRKLVQRFLSGSARKDSLSSSIREKISGLGADEEECDWILSEEDWSGLSAEEKANKIIVMPDKDLAIILPLIKIELLIRELLSLEKSGLIDGLIEKLSVLFEEEKYHTKDLAGYFSKLINVFVEEETKKFLVRFVQRLCNACLKNKEHSLPLFFAIMNPNLYNVINRLLDNHKLPLINTVIQLYSEEEKSLHSAYAVLEPIIERLLKELVNKIDANQDWKDLADILVLFKEKSAGQLLESALFTQGVESGKYFEAYLRRTAIGKILSLLPKENNLILFKDKFSDNRAYVINNLIELVGAIGDEKIVSVLKIPLGHQDASIRKKTIFVLGKLRGKESAGLLAEALSDGDVSLRKFAARTLKSRNDEYSAEIINRCRKDLGLPEEIRREL